ncbi:hypothetical protein UlMin_000669 [Ulmus minor]
METPLFSCLFSLLILLTALPIHALSAQCLTDHHSLLLQLKNQLLPNALDSTKLKKWSPNSDCCSWEGVTCKEGRVTGLDLSFEEIFNLQSLENSTLFNLQSLESLDLSYNDFNSTIPARIGNLTSLNYLNLSFAGFVGQVPSSISRLIQLVTLDLSSFTLKLEKPSLFMLIQNLTKLEELHLDRVNTSSTWNQWCEFISSSLPHLRVLGLSYSDISGPIDHSLMNLTKLEELYLHDVNMSSTRNQWFEFISSSLPHLRVLSLSRCDISGPIDHSLMNLTKLEELNLDFVNMSSTWNQWFEFISSSLPHLRVLSLSYSDISSPIDHSLMNLTKIEELNLDGVNMSSTRNQWFEFISSSLPHLRVLSLSGCDISGPIDHSLMNLQALSEITLDGNNLSSPVPLFLANLSNLVSLSLRDCELYGEFPKEIFKVPTLQTLDISGNELLQGSLPEFPQNNSLQTLLLYNTNFSGPLPTSIGNLWNLSRLYLSGCQFNGTLPNSMVKLTKLVSLYLSVNKFTGSIPSSLFKLSSLEFIGLFDNQFNGTLPNSMVKLTKLVYLDLSVNKFTGSIPSSLFKLSSLEYIDLSDNQFSGKLEFPNPSSSMLASLYLSRNKLEGPIPISIFNLRNLSRLSLSSNKLNGTIELDMFQGLPYLTYLDLSYNNLTVKTSGSHSKTFPNLETLFLSSCKLGQFPNLKNQPKLGYLDLSDNQIHGVVPNWIWEVGNGSLSHLNLSCNYLVGMQEPYSPPSAMYILDLHLNQLQGKIPILPPNTTYIDFSSNNFTGSIPSGIGYNLSLASFFSLSNNSIRGVIPESICMASSLEVLDLSKNSLNGTVPECLFTEKMALGVLNLGNNSLSGRIPNTFSRNCSLKTLDLRENVMEGHIPKSLASCYKLEVLNLGSNYLIDEFPCLLMNISSLRVLVLRSNKLYGSIECLNASVTWPMLQIFDLAHNNFNGKLPGQSFATWKAMMGTQPKLDFLQFQGQDSSTYYTDSVTVTIKDLEMNLVKILTIFTSIDLSRNKFNGPIPNEIGELTSLYSLNLSSNSLSGKMPMSLGNLRAVESLDFSRNHLIGNIPPSLTKLNFLSHLNLSFNQLVGSIPSGSQFQTFSADSFLGNEGLCGLPLIHNCVDGVAKPNANYSDDGSGIDWNFLSAEIGFIVGFGMLVGPLVFCRRWRKWYFECVDEIAFKICPLSLWRFYYRRQLASQNKRRRR